MATAIKVDGMKFAPIKFSCKSGPHLEKGSEHEITNVASFVKIAVKLRGVPFRGEKYK